MASPLSIPRQYEQALVKLARLSDDSAQELSAALHEVPDTINPSSLSLAVAAQVDTIAASDIEEIVPALFSLYVLRGRVEAAISDLVKDVAQTLEESRSGELSLSSAERPDFENRLAELLSVSRLDDMGRAAVLLVENEHSLQDARVVTDLRPIFEPDNPDAPPKGALIVHELKLVYRGNNATNHFFVALDTNDVRDLIEQLERANAKAESLKSVLKAAGVPHIDAK